MAANSPNNIDYLYLHDGSWDRLGAEIQSATGIRLNPVFDELSGNYELCFFSYCFYRELYFEPVDIDQHTGTGTAPFSSAGSGNLTKPAQRSHGDLPSNIEEEIENLVLDIRKKPKENLPQRFLDYLKELEKERGFDFSFLDTSGIQQPTRNLRVPCSLLP
jgi:hypothetical protein